jgi:hypothetical protein
MFPLRLVGINMADDASDTIGGGSRNYLGALGFILPLVGVEELVRHFVDTQHPSLPWWVSLILIAAGYPIYISPAIWKRLRRSKSPEARELEYLRHKDSELGTAIIEMTWLAAWGKWYAARELANTKKPIPPLTLLNRATSNIGTNLVNGDIEVRGRLPGEMDYRPIPRTYWRSTFPHFKEDPIALWKMSLIPTGGAKFDQDGTMTADDPMAEQRTAVIRNYDSLIVDAFQFERVWPKKSATHDKERCQFLRKALKLGLDKDEILKLSGWRAKWQLQLFRFRLLGVGPH